MIAHSFRWVSNKVLETSLAQRKVFFIANAERSQDGSKQGKLAYQLGEVQIQMRLKVSGDKTEIRQSYIHVSFPWIMKPLVDEGSVGSLIGFKLVA